MIFKVGDKVKVISKCQACGYSETCYLNCGEWEGTIISQTRVNSDDWNVEGLENGKIERCHFKEEQLVLIEAYKKEIKLYGICNFVNKYYNEVNNA